MQCVRESERDKTYYKSAQANGVGFRGSVQNMPGQDCVENAQQTCTPPVPALLPVAQPEGYLKHQHYPAKLLDGQLGEWQWRDRILHKTAKARRKGFPFIIIDCQMLIKSLLDTVTQFKFSVTRNFSQEFNSSRISQG